MKITKIEIHYKSSIPWRLGAILIAPGLNVVSQAEYDFVKDNAMFQRMVEIGNIEVLFREVEPKSHSAKKELVKTVVCSEAEKPVELAVEKSVKEAESALGALSVTDAKELVAATDNVDELVSWQEGESRKPVLKAIDSRLGELQGAV